MYKGIVRSIVSIKVVYNLKFMNQLVNKKIGGEFKYKKILFTWKCNEKESNN